jgi:DNA-binding beta-propeller fold protein YncE
MVIRQQSMETYSFIHNWGKYGDGEGGLFQMPAGVAIDRNDHVFVTDFYSNRIQRFTLNGKFELEWGQIGNREGDFFFPTGIFVDCDRDEVYVCDYCNHRIQVFDTNGNYIRAWGSYGKGDGQLKFPHDVTIDPSQNDHVFVADSGNNRIQVFSIKGEYKYQWGKAGRRTGTGDGEFNFPCSLAFNAKGLLFVADTNNHRIQFFSRDGKYVDQWGTLGQNDDQFVSPCGIKADSFGYLYVISSNKVQKFDSIGNLLAVFGRGYDNSTPEQLWNPWGVALIEGGMIRTVYVYVADSQNARVAIFQQKKNTPTLPYLPH